MPPDAPTAFFSYSRDDSDFALRLAGDLKAAGANVWLDQLDIQPGQRWARAVQDALNNSPRMLVILSPSSVASTNVEDEVNFALEEHKTVIPVFYQDCKIPFQLRPFQYVDFRTDYAHGLKVMLGTLGGEQRVPPAAAATSAMPSESKGDASDQNERKRSADQARLEEDRRQTAAEKARLEQQEGVPLEQARSGGRIATGLPSSFSRSPAWMKISVAVCGVLVAGLVLYWAFRPKQPEVLAPKPEVKTETSNPPPSGGGPSGSAVDNGTGERAAADKTAADRASADKTAARKADAAKAAADKAAGGKAATVKQQAAEDQTATAQTFAESALRMFDAGDCSGLYDAFDDSARTLTRDQWTQVCSTALKQRGKVVNRSLANKTRSMGFYNFIFNTQATEGKVFEDVAVVHKDTAWKLVSFYVKPNLQ